MVKSYAIETSISTHVFNYVAIPKFDPADKTHQELASLSQQAHTAMASGDFSKVKGVEESIDKVAATFWDLTPEELKDIQNSLSDLAK